MDADKAVLVGKCIVLKTLEIRKGWKGSNLIIYLNLSQKWRVNSKERKIRTIRMIIAA